MVDLDNSQCGKDANSINIRLEQHAELRAADGHQYNDRRVLEEKKFDGLGANQSTGGLNRYLELSLRDIKQQPRSFDDQKSLDKDDLYLAEKIQPTASGSIVKLSYTLGIYPDYGTCCAQDPSCVIPLVITPPPLPSFGQVEAPPGWSPTVFHTFNFTLPGPGEVMAEAAKAVSPVTAGFNVNVGTGEEAKGNYGNSQVKLSIDTDSINQEVPVHQPAHGVNMNMNVGGEHHHQNDNVNMNVDFSGMPGMNMNIEGGNMQMEGNVKTSYHHETKVNGVTTSSTNYRSENVPAPVPVPQPFSAGPATQEHEAHDAHVSMGMPGFQMSATAEEGNANTQMNFGGMNMNLNANVDNNQ